MELNFSTLSPLKGFRICGNLILRFNLLSSDFMFIKIYGAAAGICSGLFGRLNPGSLARGASVLTRLDDGRLGLKIQPAIFLLIGFRLIPSDFHFRPTPESKLRSWFRMGLGAG